MRELVLTLHGWSSRLMRWAAVLAGLSTFLIMWVIDINAFGRKLFNAPLPIGVELTQSLLPVVIMLPFGWALASQHHVSSEFLTTRLPAPLVRALRVFWMFVGFLLFAAVTYGTFRYALRSYDMGEQVWGATLRYPLWPSKMAVSLGTLLITIQFLLEAARAALVESEPEPQQDWEGHA